MPLNLYNLATPSTLLLPQRGTIGATGKDGVVGGNVRWGYPEVLPTCSGVGDIGKTCVSMFAWHL